jgi:hypothetical protein
MKPNPIVRLRFKARTWSIVDDWRLRRLTPGEVVIHLYRRLYRYGRWFGVIPRSGDTPHEYTAVLALRLTDLIVDRRWGKVLTSTPGEIGWLTEQSTRALYSPHPPGATERQEALHGWRRLQSRLWLARLLSWAPQSGSARVTWTVKPE